MRADLQKPNGTLGRFGVVKLWPDIKVAEDEVIARLQNTARALGLECVVIDHMGQTIDPPHRRMTQADLDFVIHLHFSTPKAYDIFSFVVLWNPLQFYYDFGYRRVSRHLLTHDDFLSCGSPAADDQLLRLTANDPTRGGVHFTMYHSVSEPVLAPTLGERKLFYSGINWERLGKGGSRHQEILDELDMSGEMRIYGPRLLRGVRVWEGYKSYQGSLPFDGVSMMHAINRTGIALVLSSEPHKDSALMSSRLFEALAGGAVIICDENPFARAHFGDTLLYIDTTEPASDVAEQILRHVRWVQGNPDAARALAERAQAIFNERYRLDISLGEIYRGLRGRQAQLEAKLAPADPELAVTLFLLLPAFDPVVLQRHLANVRSQRHAGCRPVLVVEEFDLRHFRPEIEAAVAASGLAVDVRTARFFVRDGRGAVVGRVRFGRLLAALLGTGDAADLFCLVAPNEEIHATHIQALAGALSRHPQAGYAHSGMLLRHRDPAGETACEVHEPLDFLDHTPNFPFGHARLLFRLSAVSRSVEVMLPYLDLTALSGLALHAIGVPSRRMGVVLDIQHAFNVGETGAGASAKPFEQRLQEENEIVRDFDPDAFDRVWRMRAIEKAQPSAADQLAGRPAGKPLQVEHLMPASLYVDRLSRRNRQVLLAQLVQSLPIPRLVWALLRPLRPWRREPAVRPLDDRA
jgi:hypothetical protein